MAAHFVLEDATHFPFFLSSGNPLEYCGGSAALSVYRLPAVKLGRRRRTAPWFDSE